MPRKNKKKQRKEERKKTMQRVRQEKGWQPPPDVEFVDDEIMRDLLTLIPELGGDEPPGAAAAETLTDVVLESYDLIDEPELNEIWFHPLEAISVYAELEDERGVNEEMLNSLSEDEEDELFFDLMVEIVRRTMTEEMKEDVLDALEAIWQRVRLEGDQEKAGRLAGMMMLLGSADGEDIWPEVGLIQEILRRSLDAGFEMVRVMESADAQGLNPRERLEAGMDDQVQQQLDAIVQKYPGLAAVMQELDEEAWHQNIQALMDGELYIGIFREEELERAAEILAADIPGEGGLGEEELKRAKIHLLQEYIAGLLTPDRRAEMREQLLSLLEDEALAGEWESFLAAMLYEMDDEDPKKTIVLLTAAIFGEMADVDEEDDEEDDEAQD